MAAAKKAAAAKAAADMPAICTEHWPDGWPNEEYSSIACEHGSWTHPNFAPPEAGVVEMGDAAADADAAADGDEDAPKF